MEKQQEDELHPDILRGFNEGYFLAKEMPQFANDMGKYLPNTERSIGFIGGVEQYSKDIAKLQQRELVKDYKVNKDSVGVNKNSPDNLKRDFIQTKDDLGVNTKEHITSWLTERSENKSDMGLDREHSRSDIEREPER